MALIIPKLAQHTSTFLFLDFELLDEEEVSAESIHRRFRKYEELLKELTEVYMPIPVSKQSEEAPVYIPTPKSYGPKPLTIEEYKARQRPVRPIELPQAKKKHFFSI